MSEIIKKRNPDNEIFVLINKRTKTGEYTILPKSSQFKYCEKVLLRGFERLPSGFWTNDGYGLTGAGGYMLQEVSEKYGKKIALTISDQGTSKIDGRGTLISVTLPHRELVSINAEVRNTKRERNEEIKAEVRAFLARQFQRQFKEYAQASPQYAPGTLSQLLDQKDILGRLGNDDREKLELLIPEYLKSIQGTLRAKNKLQVIFDSLDAGKKVYMEKIIKEFRSKLKRKVQNEAIWQKFLSEYILVLRNNYGEVLEKESVTLQGKFPDFMLLDPYNYLDIYEIKKPTTNLLKHDASRNNYYWDSEVSKAISQVENYLHQVQRSSDTLINDIRRSKGLEVSIVRPNGYIIAGTRDQLTNPKMLDDFRILSEGLKNIDVILYDDLLMNLESFVKKIGT